MKNECSGLVTGESNELYIPAVQEGAPGKLSWRDGLQKKADDSVSLRKICLLIAK